MKFIKNFLSCFKKEKPISKSLSENTFDNIFLIQKDHFEDFYSTIKFKNGEEVFARIVSSNENGKTILLLNSPIKITEINSKRRGMVSGYKVEPWLKTTNNDLFVVDLEDVLTLTESSDNKIIQMYETFIKQINGEEISKETPTRKMGYISNVKDAKELLEKLYNNS